MKIVFFSNFINHHQVPVSDVLYELTNGDYYFVELRPMFEWLKQGGYEDLSSRPYVIQAWKDDLLLNKAKTLCLEADVALFGGPEALDYQVIRAKAGKLSFEVSERWLKRGALNLLSPRLLKNMWYYHTLFKHKPMYKLCSSAYGAKDQYKLKSYYQRCYKWGYFTKVDYDRESLFNAKRDITDVITIMWCARFLKWKHPELPVQLAARLKAKGYKFTIDMYGSGVEHKRTKELISTLGVGDLVRLCGNLPNEKILDEMAKHEIFLFTSDSHEGWGAVANEAMSNGCVLVGSDAIGSIPYLLNDGENGMIFKSCDLKSLEDKVEYLINNPSELKKMSANGYKTIRDIWSPENAAKSLMVLIDDIISGREISIIEGPCSIAIPL